MSKPEKIRHVLYRHLLDDKVPLVSYDLYEDENRRYAFLTFNNSTIYTVKSFKLKITFFTAEHDGLNTVYFEFDTPYFYSHHNYSPEEPLIFPKNADGFNYEILEVETPSKNVERERSLRILGVSKDFVPSNKSSIKGDNIAMAKPHWIPCVAVLGCALLGSVPYFGISIATNAEFNRVEDGTMFSYDSIDYVTTSPDTVTVVKAYSEASKVSSEVYYNNQLFYVTRIQEYAFDGFSTQYLYIEGNEKYPIQIDPYAFNNCMFSSMEFRYCDIYKRATFSCYNLNEISLTSCNVFTGAFTDCFSLVHVSVSKDTSYENNSFPKSAIIDYM